MKTREVLLFTTELSDLLASGMTLGNALNCLANRKSDKVGDEIMTSEELAAFHRGFLDDYNFCFYEDPFGPDDVAPWRALTE